MVCADHIERQLVEVAEAHAALSHVQLLPEAAYRLA
jgi:hypothetical protein